MSSYSLLLLLALGHLMVDMHQGGLPVLLPVLKETYGLTYAQTGSLVLWSQITSSVIQPVFGVLSDRISARWLMPVSLMIATVGMAMVGLATQYTWVVCGVLVMGLGVAAYHPEGSKVVHFVGGERKGQAMSLFALGGNIGLALGPLVMATGLALAGLRGTLTFVPITIGVVILFRVMLDRLYAGWSTSDPADPAGESSAKSNTNESGIPVVRSSTISRATWWAFSILIAVIILRSFAHTALITFIPLYYTTHLDNPATYSSVLLTAFLIAGAVGTAVGGPLSDRIGPRRVILWSFILSAPIFLILPFVTTGVAPFIVVTVGGFTLISSFAVTTVLGQILLPNQVGLASGLTLGFSVGTGGFGVTALGYVADILGLGAAMISISVLLILGIFVSLLLPKDEKKDPAHLPSETA